MLVKKMAKKKEEKKEVKEKINDENLPYSLIRMREEQKGD